MPVQSKPDVAASVGARCKPMRTPAKLSRIICLVGIFGFAAALGVHLAGGRSELEWRRDFQAAQQEAAASGKPILLDFSATWCGPCQRMKAETLTDPAVVIAMRGYIPVAVNADESPDLVRKYGVDSIPAFVVVDSTGARTARPSEVGYTSPADFIRWLRSGPQLHQ